MTWHLKDRELEKKLDEISNGDFSKQLNKVENVNAFNHGFYLVFGKQCLTGEISNNAGACRKYQAFIERKELEEVKYNPNDWNDYPDVIPPNSNIYRLMVCYGKYDPIEYYAAVYTFGSKTWWPHGSDRPIDTTVSEDGFVKFRPWDD